MYNEVIGRNHFQGQKRFAEGQPQKGELHLVAGAAGADEVA